MSPDGFGIQEVAELIGSTPHDVIYLNSFFDRFFTQKVLINRWLGRGGRQGVILAPRGEFSDGALNLKRYRKRAYIFVTGLLKLYADIVWQASSTLEAADLERSLSIGLLEGLRGRLSIAGQLVVAPDLVAANRASGPDGTKRLRRPPSRPLRVCFLSRISPMKNLDFALRILSQVKIPVRFSIIGPIEDRAYWRTCQELISILPSHVEVVNVGPVEPDQVPAALAGHDLFLLPTRGENYGHVIHEALRAGLPLLISLLTLPGVTWRVRVSDGELPLSEPAAYVRRIEEVARWSQEDIDRVAQNAASLSVEVADNSDALQANYHLFLER